MEDIEFEERTYEGRHVEGDRCAVGLGRRCPRVHVEDVRLVPRGSFGFNDGDVHQRRQLLTQTGCSREDCYF